MKKPMPPPPLGDLMADLMRSDQFLSVLNDVGRDITSQAYLPWDVLRYKQPPGDLTVHQWWAATKFARTSLQRSLPLVGKEGRPFTYALPDGVLRAIEKVNSDASGHISISEQVTNPATRDRYLVNSLIEEAITSSQLEGASTERHVAKQMIRSGRPPRDRSERMILNNFIAMRRVGELRNEELSQDLIFEIHRIVTDGTLDNPDAAGRYQRPGEERIAVFNNEESLLYTPPPAETIAERMDLVFDFANARLTQPYMPPVLRAITLHFMIGYEHPFEDGNGRTARALFYWSMLRQGYWLTEFLAISRILKGAPSKYGKSFLYTETDDNDLTYFFDYQLGVILRAISELHNYLGRKMEEVRELQKTLSMAPGQFNHRELALLQHATRGTGTYYTMKSHSGSHNVTIETARLDLMHLVSVGLLKRERSGRQYFFFPVPNLADELRQA